MNQFVYGDKAYSDSSSAGIFDNALVSAQLSVSRPLSADTLSADVASIVVNDFDLDTRFVAVDGMLAAVDGMLAAAVTNNTGLKVYHYGDPLMLYSENQLIGKFYLESIQRVGKDQWQFNGTSGIGLLIATKYYGGVFSGISLSDLLAQVMGGVVEFSLDPSLSDIPMYGWLAISTRRDALHMCLFAVGATAYQSSAGVLTISPQSPKTPLVIPDSSIYMGGTVQGLTPATQVSVVEHAFSVSATSEPVTLFEGEAAAELLTTPLGSVVEGLLVAFSEPMYDLSAENGVILESGANYAVLGQAPYVILTGRPYAHTQRVLSRILSSSGTPNAVSSEDCTLVNLLNSENVLTRLCEYYGNAQTTELDIVPNGYAVGDAVSFTDQFGDTVSGYIESMETTLSSVLKSRVSAVVGYVPGGSGNFYTASELIIASGYFTVPSGANDKIRVVLCSGAQGGEDGSPGEAGSRASAGVNGTGGEGGTPGKPGAGGRICVYTVAVSPGQVFPVTIGKGGTRGVNGVGGSLGSDTFFGSLSTEQGSTSEVGYTDLITGTIYGTPGENGVPGGSGNGPTGTEAQPVVSPQGTTNYPGAQGEQSSAGPATAAGGYGGGAAAGSNGGDGKNGDAYNQPDGSYFASGGAGGAGATPESQSAATVPGGGGPGGHGGGGGGGGGTAASTSGTLEWFGNGGTPGQGGLAGDGADGFVIVYY